MNNSLEHLLSSSLSGSSYLSVVNIEGRFSCCVINTQRRPSSTQKFNPISLILFGIFAPFQHQSPCSRKGKYFACTFSLPSLLTPFARAFFSSLFSSIFLILYQHKTDRPKNRHQHHNIPPHGGMRACWWNILARLLCGEGWEEGKHFWFWEMSKGEKVVRFSSNHDVLRCFISLAFPKRNLEPFLSWITAENQHESQQNENNSHDPWHFSRVFLTEILLCWPFTNFSRCKNIL